jgi:hypothetical protein
MFHSQGLLLNIPRYKATQVREGLYESYDIPEHNVLMLQPRFRMLREHYYTKGSEIQQCALDLNSLEHKLISNRKSLAQIQNEALKLAPLFNEIKEETDTKYAEMHIVAKQRSKVNKSQKSSILRSKKLHIDVEGKVLAPIPRPDSSKMRQFYAQSVVKVSYT